MLNVYVKSEYQKSSITSAEKGEKITTKQLS